MVLLPSYSILKERPLSNGTIIIICRLLGVISLVFNVIGLYLVQKTWNIYSRSIFTVLMLLQADFICKRSNALSKNSSDTLHPSKFSFYCSFYSVLLHTARRRILYRISLRAPLCVLHCKPSEGIFRVSL